MENYKAESERINSVQRYNRVTTSSINFSIWEWRSLSPLQPSFLSRARGRIGLNWIANRRLLCSVRREFGTRGGWLWESCQMHKQWLDSIWLSSRVLNYWCLNYSSISLVWRVYNREVDFFYSQTPRGCEREGMAKRNDQTDVLNRKCLQISLKSSH